MRVDAVPSLGDRTTYLGASDVAAIMGLDEHRTPQDVWRQKTGQAEPEKLNEHIERGHLMEDVIHALVERIDGVKLYPAGAIAVVGTPITVHPDRVDNENRIHELKAPTRFSAQWGKQDTDEVPRRYIVQVLMQMWAAAQYDVDPKLAFLHAMAGERRRYVIGYDSDTANRIAEYAIGWWAKHVTGGDEPPPVSMDELNRIAKRKPQVVVAQDIVDQVRRLAWLRKVETRAKDLADETKRDILAKLGVDGALPESIGDSEGNVVATVRRASRKRIDAKRMAIEEPDAARFYEVTDEWNELRPAKGLPLVQTPEILAIGEEL